MEQKLFFNKKLTDLTSDPSGLNNLLGTLDFHDWTSTGGDIISNKSFSSAFINKFQNHGFYFHDDTILKSNSSYRLEIEGTSTYDIDGAPATFTIYNKISDINITASIVSNYTLFIGTADGRVYASTNGVDWTLRKKVNSKITAFGYTLDYVFFGTEGCELYRWLKTDINLQNWEYRSNVFGDRPPKPITCISTTNNLEVCVGVYGDIGVYRSLDDGDTWGGFKNGWGPMPNREILPTEWYVTSLLYISSDEIYASVDNWSQEYSSKYSIFRYATYSYLEKYWKAIGGTNTINKKVKTLVRNQNNGKFFFGTYGTLFSDGGIFRSTDAGVSWTQLPISTSRNINKIIVSSSGKLFAATESSLITSNDDGNSWSQKIINNGNPEIQTVSIFENNIFVGTNKDVFTLIDEGETWLKNRLRPQQITPIGINGELINTSPFSKTIIFTTGNDIESQKLYLENSSLFRFWDPITTTITKLELYNYSSTDNFIKFIGLSNVNENEGLLLPKKEMLLDINIVNNYFNLSNSNNIYSNPVDFSLIVSNIKNTEDLNITNINSYYMIYIGQLNENKIFFIEPEPGHTIIYKPEYTISLKNFLLPQEIDADNTDYYLHLLLHVTKINETTNCNISITGVGYQL